ncbi:hypothetical protein C0991_006598 [Blastosporella zonata]|nr:hypothetical protein C0991_006598 [Blastosporella zonata]
MTLSPFGLSCYVDDLGVVKQVVVKGLALKIEGTETPYEFGYATLITSGAQRVEPQRSTDLLGILKYLFYEACLSTFITSPVSLRCTILSLAIHFKSIFPASSLNLGPTPIIKTVTEKLRFCNKFFGIDDNRPDAHYRSWHVPKNLHESKNIMIKDQLAYNIAKNKPEPGAASVHGETRLGL